MLKVFTLLIVLMSTGFGLQYMISANIQASLMLQTDMMAQSALSQLRKEVIVENDVAFVPYGQESTYHELPTYFSINRATRSGIPFLYCPYSTQPSVVNDGTVSNGAGSYSVDIINNAITEGRDYVSGSNAPSIPNLLAAIIAPSFLGASPDCNDIGVNAGGMLILTGASQQLGKVYALTAFDVLGTTDTNTLVLNDPSTQSVTDALNNVGLSPTENFTFVLPSGDPYQITGSSDVVGGNFGDRQLIVIRGFSAANPAILNSVSNANLRFENMQVVLENVIISKNVSFEFIDSDVLMRNASTGPVASQSSDMIIDSVSIDGSVRNLSAIQLSLSTLRVRDNTLSIESNTNPVSLIQESTVQIVNSTLDIGMAAGVIGVQIENGALIFRGSDVNYQNVDSAAQAIVYTDDASRLFFQGGDINGSGLVQFGVYSEGRSVFDTANLNFDNEVGVSVFNAVGSEAIFDVTVLGVSTSKPAVGIFDAGSKMIKGNVQTFAVLCEDGVGFTRIVTANVQDSVVSQVNPDFSVIVTDVDKTIDIDVSGEFNKLNNTCL